MKQMRAATKSRERRDSGFTFVEVAISMGVLAILMASVCSIAVETSSFLGDTDVDVVVQMEAHRAFTRLADVLRKSGRVTSGGVTYPRVTGGGGELEFRILTDLDGNGYAFDAATAALEWDPRVFAIRTDEEGNLDVYDGNNKVYTLGRFIEELRFQTIEENNSLHLKEILVEFEASKALRSGDDVTFPVRGSIHMRN